MANTNKLSSYEWIINPNRKPSLGHNAVQNYSRRHQNHLAFRREVQYDEKKPAINTAFT